MASPAVIDRLQDSEQVDICVWSKNTFGSHPAIRIAARMNLEVQELLSEAARHERKKTCEEAADVTIILLQVAEASGVRLAQLCASKKPINRWRDPLFLGIDISERSARIILLLSQEAACPAQQLAAVMVEMFQLLEELTTNFGRDLATEVRTKMAINRARKWVRTPQGHHQHEEPTA